MSLPNLRPGDVSPMTSATVIYGTSKEYLKATYKATRGRRMVFMFLGDEPADGSAPLDAAQRLRDLGWKPEEEPA